MREKESTAFTQFARVCSTMPKAFAAAIFSPEETKRIASRLYSNV